MSNYTCMLGTTYDSYIGYGTTLLEACNNASIGLVDIILPVMGTWSW